MRQIAQSYSYNSSTKVLTLTGVNVPQGNLVLIYNVTAGKRAYSVDLGFIDAISAYSQATNSTVTLRDGSGFSNSDVFSVVYEDGVQSTAPLTDTQLRATAVPVSGTVTANTGLSQPLTDTQLRATAVPVSGTVTSRIADGAGNNLTSAARGSERALSVQIVDASGAQVTSFGGGGGGTVTATQTTPSALKAQAQILDATGSQMSFVNAGIAGTPSVDVLTVQGSTSGTPIPVQVASYSVATSVQFSNFTGTTSTAIAGADANRKVLTIFNEGTGLLYVKPAAYAGDVVSTSSYQIRMSPGDYWEVPKEQLRFQHLGIFASVGTARITSIS